MSHQFKNTTEELKYIVTGTENPKFLSEREKVIINLIAKHLDDKNKVK